jgi:two-component system chemotaxis response regulator CheB
MIRVLIVDDSPTSVQLLNELFLSADDFEVVGCASTGHEALALCARLQPDIVSMDVLMSDQNGFEVTRQIMAQYPVPIVIVSAEPEDQNNSLTFRALEAGALGALNKPRITTSSELARHREELLFTFRAMAGVKVVRRRPSGAPSRPIALPQPPQVVVIGASTGGPQALQSLLEPLPASFPLPILVVQHIASGFTDGFCRWLGLRLALSVQLARHGEVPQPGCIYIAPEARQMGFSADRRIQLADAPAEHGVCPSVSFLFRSAHQQYGGAAVGILLSGMGRDGAAELKTLHDAGARTLVQDADSSVVHGMPGEAVRLQAASQILAPAAMATTLCQLLGQPQRS